MGEDPEEQDPGEDTERDEGVEEEVVEDKAKNNEAPQSEINVTPTTQTSPNKAAAHTTAHGQPIFIMDVQGNPIKPVE